MDIRSMQYYLAVVREGTISGAAEVLHVAQPSLSRQMKDLEEELGISLFERGNRKITLTEEGMVLRRRAEEMVRLMQMTKKRSPRSKTISPVPCVSVPENLVPFNYLSRTASLITQEHPDTRFQVTSGNTQDLMDELNNGLIDFAVIYTDVDHALYQAIELPAEDQFGLLMHKNAKLSAKDAIEWSDLKGLPLMISRSSEPYLSSSGMLSSMHIIATYNLIYNASLMVEDGVGYALCFDKLINTAGDSPLVFRPLTPPLSAKGRLIWKKYQIFSPAVQLFIDQMQEIIPAR